MTTDTIAILSVETQDGTKKIPLYDGQTLAVGRDPNNELSLDDSSVSRVHACFTATIHGVVLADLSSKNGTFLNGERITSFRDLVSGDIIDIGSTKISINFDTRESVAAPNPLNKALTTELHKMNVTVLLVTFADYKKVQKCASEEQLNKILIKWREKVCSVIEELGGSVDKIFDKSIVAIWIGDDAQQQAVNAAQAGLKISNVTKDLSIDAECQAEGIDTLNCSVVLTSGAAIKGDTTSQKPFVLLGDPINTASCLEEAISKLGHMVIIHKSTADLIKDKIGIKRLIGLNIRDGELPVDIFVPSK